MRKSQQEALSATAAKSQLWQWIHERAREDWLEILRRRFAAKTLLYQVIYGQGAGRPKRWLELRPPKALSDGLRPGKWLLGAESDGRGAASNGSSVRGISRAERYLFADLKIVATDTSGKSMPWTLEGKHDSELSGAARRLMDLVLSTRPGEEQRARHQAHDACVAEEQSDPLLQNPGFLHLEPEYQRAILGKFSLTASGSLYLEPGNSCVITPSKLRKLREVGNMEPGSSTLARLLCRRPEDAIEGEVNFIHTYPMFPSTPRPALKSDGRGTNSARRSGSSRLAPARQV